MDSFAWVALVVGCLMVAAALWLMEVRRPRARAAVDTPLLVSAQTPQTPILVRVEAPPPPKLTPLTVRLVSGSGRPLGTYTYPDARLRRPGLKQRTGAAGEASVFMAERQDDTGQWIYRRVGVEREG